MGTARPVESVAATAAVEPFRKSRREADGDDTGFDSVGLFD